MKVTVISQERYRMILFQEEDKLNEKKGEDDRKTEKVALPLVSFLCSMREVGFLSQEKQNSFDNRLTLDTVLNGSAGKQGAEGEGSRGL